MANHAVITVLFSAIHDFTLERNSNAMKFKVHDQLNWCACFHSLCLDQGGGIILITDESSKHGQPVNLLNDLGPSPWHAPDARNLTKSFLGQFDVPFRSFFKVARYASSQPSGSVTVRGWSLVAAFDGENFNIYHYT
tara:strand:- start:155 stop:565 length:411 start_codon:yes stop_codon:yes gene_type:complete